MGLCQSVKRLQTHSIITVNIKKKTPPSSGRVKFPFVFTNHLIHNQVGYASSELHDSTQRKEIFPTTKTYFSFNKDFARLLILMQCINKLYLYSLYSELALVCCTHPDDVHCCGTILPNQNLVLRQSVSPVRSIFNPRPITKLINFQLEQLVRRAMGAAPFIPMGSNQKTALWR